MHRFRFVLILVAFVFTACGSTHAAADDAKKPTAKQPKFELRDGDRVVFLGNTLIERAQKYGYWETMLTARYPNKNITFRNLGWSGDTVWAESRGMFDPPAVGYKRMIEHIGRLKPTVIFVGYGNNEAFAGKAGLPAFVKQYNTLLDDLTRVSAKGVRFVILSPLPVERIGPPLLDPGKRNRILDHYVIALKELAHSRQMRFVDIFKPTKVIYTIAFNRRPPLTKTYTDDGIHCKGSGYQATGEILLERLDLKPMRPKATIRSSPTVRISANGKSIDFRGERVTELRFHRLGVHIQMQRDVISHYSREWNIRTSRFERNPVLPEPGRYALKIDGKTVVTTDRQRMKVIHQPTDPDIDQFHSLRQTIIEKNRLYFYSWRPQNITYLTGFRKHEQGQNAKEIAEFDKLIVAKEKEINKLKKPVAHTYEIIRVKKDK